MQMFPALGDCQDGDFLVADSNNLCDLSRNRREGRLHRVCAIPIESAGNTFQFRNKAENRAHGDSSKLRECNQEGLRPGVSRCDDDSIFKRRGAHPQEKSSALLFAKKPSHRTGPFASPDTSAYTVLAAILKSLLRVVRREPASNPAAERACLTRQLGLA